MQDVTHRKQQNIDTVIVTQQHSDMWLVITFCDVCNFHFVTYCI